MCGIVGYVGAGRSGPIVLDGLGCLEYRGYDSAGIAVLGPRRRADASSRTSASSPTCATRLEGAMPPRQQRHRPHALGHPRQGDAASTPTRTPTRPATSSSSTTASSRTTVSCAPSSSPAATSSVPRPTPRSSLTSSPRRIDAGLDLEEATRAAMRRIEGAAAMLAMRRQEPGVLVAARIANAGGVVIGYGDGEMFVASDLPALARPHPTRRLPRRRRDGARHGRTAPSTRASTATRSRSGRRRCRRRPSSRQGRSTSTSCEGDRRAARGAPRHAARRRRVRPAGREPRRPAASPTPTSPRSGALSCSAWARASTPP